MNSRFISIIQACLSKNLNFSVFSIPGSKNFEVVIENPIQSQNKTTGFVFHPFEVSSDSSSVFIPADLHFHSSEISDFQLALVSSFPTQKAWINNVDLVKINKDSYVNNLTKAIGSMPQYKVDKFIYSRILATIKPNDLDLAKYLITLNETHENAYSYLISHQQSGIWMGATPETLVSWNGGRVSTMSLAGTQPYSDTLPQWSLKEKEEHDYVTKYIEKAFQRSAISFETHPTQTVKAGPVYHLKTEINSTKNITFSQAMDLGKKLHPTPAICGVPLENAKIIIDKTENHSRLYYTGFLGFVEPNKKVEFFVNLRCLQVLPNHLALYLGGGITEKSVAESEWNETIHKSQTLLKVLHSL